MAFMQENSREVVAPAAPGKLVPVLASVLALQVVFYVGLRTAPWFAERGWEGPSINPQRRMVEWRRAVALAEKDPVPGMELPSVPLRDLEGRPAKAIRPGKPTVLLFVGDATSCSVKSLLSTWVTLKEKHPDLQVVGVATRAEGPVAEMCSKKAGKVRLVLDADGALAETLNARWKPRAYLLDRQTRLAYVQPDTVMDSLAVGEVERLLERKSF